MSLVTRTIPSLNNGISLQPPILRSADQTEDELNTWVDIARGVSRRPPTQHVADLNVTNIEDAFVHHINRDKNERYIVVIADGALRVFDGATGEEKTVTAPFGWGYLAGAPAGAFKAVTVADYTFIVNSSVTVELDDLGADTATPPADLPSPGGTLSWGRLVSL
ncbi:phage nozzle protein [Novosphingobium meiothermophilum]|uniref:phage nozzle protein n=1 Tax=Novosphingobium meiothermophilum TaxID=2202251 RepID=UPI000D6E96D5|nr:hypothetical protein [Novosphingobium meiothermophilum]